MSIHDDTLVSLQQENQRLEVEIDRLRAENAELKEKTAILLDHYLACYEGNEDKLAIETRTILNKLSSSADKSQAAIPTVLGSAEPDCC